MALLCQARFLPSDLSKISQRGGELRRTAKKWGQGSRLLVSCCLKPRTSKHTRPRNVEENLGLLFKTFSLDQGLHVFPFFSLICIIRSTTFTFTLWSLAKGPSGSQVVTNDCAFPRGLSCCNFHNLLHNLCPPVPVLDSCGFRGAVFLSSFDLLSGFRR